MFSNHKCRVRGTFPFLRRTFEIRCLWLGIWTCLRWASEYQRCVFSCPRKADLVKTNRARKETKQMKLFMSRVGLRGVSLAVICVSLMLAAVVVIAADPNCTICKGIGSVRVKCSTCSGVGTTSEKCRACDGAGTKRSYGHRMLGWSSSEYKCASCQGSGQRRVPCKGCNGTRSFLRNCECFGRSPQCSRATAPNAAPVNQAPAVATASVTYCYECDHGYITVREECDLCEEGVNHLRLKDGRFECRLCKEKLPTRHTKCKCGSGDCSKCDGKGILSEKKEKCVNCVGGIITPLKVQENAKRRAELREKNQTPAPTDTSSAAEKLKQLKGLHESGILTDSEYENKRKELIDQL